jgi:hypothetical protein
LLCMAYTVMANIHYKGFENKATINIYLAGHTQSPGTVVDAYFMSEWGKCQIAELAFINGAPTGAQLDDGDKRPGRFCFNLRATPQWIHQRIIWWHRTLADPESAFPETAKAIERFGSEFEYTLKAWLEKLVKALALGYAEFKHWFIKKFISVSWFIVLLAAPATAKQTAKMILRSLDAIQFSCADADLVIDHWGDLSSLNAAKVKLRIDELQLNTEAIILELKCMADDGMIVTYQRNTSKDYYDIHKHFKRTYPSVDKVMCKWVDGTSSSNANVEQNFSTCSQIMAKNCTGISNCSRMFLSSFLSEIENSTLAKLNNDGRIKSISKKNGTFKMAYLEAVYDKGEELQIQADAYRTSKTLEGRHKLGKQSLKAMDRTWRRDCVSSELEDTYKNKFSFEEVLQASKNIANGRTETPLKEKVVLPLPIQSFLKKHVKGFRTETVRPYNGPLEAAMIMRNTVPAIGMELVRTGMGFPNLRNDVIEHTLYDNIERTKLKKDVTTKGGALSLPNAFEYINKLIVAPCARNIIAFMEVKDTGNLRIVLRQHTNSVLKIFNSTT